MTTWRGKLTVELAETLLAHLRDGLFRENACALVGIHADTLKAWMRRGREEIDAAQHHLELTGRRRKLGRYGDLVVSVLAAEARTEAKLVGVVTRIATAGTDERAQLAAATWYLERKRNLVYGRGALRVDLNVAEDVYDGSTEDRDTDEVLLSLKRYTAALERGASTQ